MKFAHMISVLAGAILAVVPMVKAADQRPNVLFIISDDHAAAALGTCDKDSPVPLPGFRRMAREGMVFDRAYCANSLCGPSRACMLTGRHSHNNGFLFNDGGPDFDGAQPTYPKMLQKAGYQTGIIGKWHLQSQPTGFDNWQIFLHQGQYWNPTFLAPNAQGKTVSHREPGYVSDVLTTKAISWIHNRDKSRPFCLVLGHKAPHRNWLMAPRHMSKIRQYVAKLTPPADLHEDWANRPEFLLNSRQTVSRDLCNWNDNHLVQELIPFDVMKEIVPKPQLRNMVKNGRFKDEIPANFDWKKHEPKFAPITNLSFNPRNAAEPGINDVYYNFYADRTREFVRNFRAGKYPTIKEMTEQRWRWYMEDYLGTVMALDESVGLLLDYLDQEGLSENTLVIYVGDQSFYLGEHGLYDKRWIFEESFRMPLIMRWKGHIKAGARSEAMVQNIDYAPTIVELAGADTPENTRTFDGISLTPLFKTGDAPQFRDRTLYYAFYEQPGEHNAARHDGIRTKRYTFARIWTPTAEERKSGKRIPSNEWMLFDNEKDPHQTRNVAFDPEYKDVFADLKANYEAARQQYRVPANLPGDGPKKPTVRPSWGPGPQDRLP